jgi:hypothetical protein
MTIFDKNGVVWPLIIDQRLIHLTPHMFPCHRSHSLISGGDHFLFKVGKENVMVVPVVRVLLWGYAIWWGRESLGLEMGSWGREFDEWTRGRKDGLALQRQGQRWTMGWRRCGKSWAQGQGWWIEAVPGTGRAPIEKVAHTPLGLN